MGGVNCWVIVEDSESPNASDGIKFLALWKADKKPHFWEYTDTNAFRIVKVKNSQGTVMVQAAINALCPDGFGGYQAGDAWGNCGQSELDEANAALDACYQLINEGSSDIAACEAAVERLEAAIQALKKSIKGLEPGFYYMVNLGRQSDGGHASPYDERTSTTLQWDYNSNNLTPVATVETSPYIWEITSDGDLWNIKSFVTQRYIGTAEWISEALPWAEEPFAYSIEPITGLTGYFNIRNHENSERCVHAAVDNFSLVYWDPATADGSNWASAWAFVKVSEDNLEELRAFGDLVNARESLPGLIDKATVAYNSSKNYVSDLAHDGSWDAPGLVIYDEALQNITTNAAEPAEGSLASLTDGDMDTYFHSMWSTAPEPNDWHYLEIDFGKAVQEVMMKYGQRGYWDFMGTKAPGSPVWVTILSSDDAPGVANRTWKEEKTIELSYQYPATYTKRGEVGTDPFESKNSIGVAGFEMDAPHRYIRLVVKKTIGNGLTNGYPFFYWSELRLYEGQGYDPDHSILGMIEPEVTQALLDELANAQEALEADNVTKEGFDALQAAYDRFTEYQHRKALNCELSGVTYKGEAIALAEEGTTVVDRGYKEDWFVLECAGDPKAKVTREYDENTGLLTVTVRGSDAAYHVNNVHTYTFQFSLLVSVLSAASYNGEEIAFIEEEVTLVDHIYAGNEDKFVVECEADEDASIEKAYDPETGRLVVTVTGSNVATDPTNVHTYTFQFNLPKNSILTAATYGEESITLTEEEVIVVDHIYINNEEKFAVECASDEDASIETAYAEETGVLTVTVTGSDVAENPTNVHTYTFQFNLPKNSVLTGAAYGEEEIILAEEGTTMVNHIYINNEEKFTMECASDEKASYETAYAEETGVLTVTVTGSDVAENPTNVRTYTFQFNLPKNSVLTGAAYGEEEITLAEEGTTVVDHIYFGNEDKFAVECPSDEDANILNVYDKASGLLTVTVTGSDVDENPDNVHTYYFQFNLPKKSQLTAMNYDGTDYTVVQDGRIVVIEQLYDEEKVSLECESDPDATFELEYDEETGMLIITVTGSDVAENPDNVRTYKYLFSVATAIDRLFSTSAQDVYTTSGVLVRKQATSLKGLPKGIYVVNGQKVILK